MLKSCLIFVVVFLLKSNFTGERYRSVNMLHYTILVLSMSGKYTSSHYYLYFKLYLWYKNMTVWPQTRRTTMMELQCTCTNSSVERLCGLTLSQIVANSPPHAYQWALVGGWVLSVHSICISYLIPQLNTLCYERVGWYEGSFVPCQFLLNRGNL